MKNRSMIFLFIAVIMTMSLLPGCRSFNKTHLPEAGEMGTSAAESGKTDTSASEAVETDTSATEAGEMDSSATEAGEMDSSATEAGKMDSSATEAADKENNKRFSFADISNLEFYFSSGAGAWRTILTVNEDGTFEGEYCDSDVGTNYVCSFTGTFTEPEKVNDYTYSAEIERIELEMEPGLEETKDGIRFVYSEPYGLEDAKELLFYMPGAPVRELPEDYRSWVGMGGDASSTDTQLPFYGLYNVNAKNGFSSYEKADKFPIDDELANVSMEADELQHKLQTEAVTQLEMTEISSKIYQLWDNELNTIWSRISEKMDAEAVDALTAEEREWIRYKDNEIQKAGAEYEGGSMRPMAENQKGAELTKARVYELAEYLH